MNNAITQLDEPLVYDHEADADLKLSRSVADWGADELFHGAPRRRFRPAGAGNPAPRRASGPVAPVADRSHLQVVPDPEPHTPRLAAVPEVAPAGRKTVTITGRPGPLGDIPRRRPPMTVEQRLGDRPDHVAMWAFGLGLLLIVIAVLTA